jgi:hypothetical protein
MWGKESLLTAVGKHSIVHMEKRETKETTFHHASKDTVRWEDRFC